MWRKSGWRFNARRSALKDLECREAIQLEKRIPRVMWHPFIIPRRDQCVTRDAKHPALAGFTSRHVGDIDEIPIS